MGVDRCVRVGSSLVLCLDGVVDVAFLGCRDAVVSVDAEDLVGALLELGVLRQLGGRSLVELGAVVAERLLEEARRVAGELRGRLDKVEARLEEVEALLKAVGGAEVREFSGNDGVSVALLRKLCVNAYGKFICRRERVEKAKAKLEEVKERLEARMEALARLADALAVLASRENLKPLLEG